MNVKLIFVPMFLLYFTSTWSQTEIVDPDAVATVDPEVIDKALVNENLEDLISRLDLNVPESPAFTVLDVSSEQVINPANYRTLAFSLLNGLDPSGNGQIGLAIDTKPFYLVGSSSYTLDEYRKNKAMRLLSRLQPVSYTHLTLPTSHCG